MYIQLENKMSDDNDDIFAPDGALLDMLKKVREDDEHNLELEIDRAMARAMVAGIMSRAEGDKEHAKFLTVTAVLYVNAAADIKLEEFIDLLREGDEHTNIKVENIGGVAIREVEDDPEAEDGSPKQNAPTSNKIQ